MEFGHACQESRKAGLDEGPGSERSSVATSPRSPRLKSRATAEHGAKLATGPSLLLPSHTGEPRDQQSWIDALRVLSCFAIVVIHVTAKHHLGRQDLHTLDWWITNVFNASTRFAIPVFFMISGALLLDPRRPETTAAFYRKRMSRLLLPFVFWVTFYAALSWRQYPEARTLGHLGREFLSGRVYYHLWYLFVLPGLYGVTPFLRSFLRGAAPREVLWLSGVIYVLAVGQRVVGQSLFGGQETVFTMFLPYVSYYLLGYWLANEFRGHMTQLRDIVAALCSVSLIAGTVGLVAERFPARESLYYLPYSPLSPLALAYAVVVFLGFKHGKVFRGPRIGSVRRCARLIAPTTLGIYLVHPFLIYLLETNLPNRWFLDLPALSIPFTSALVFATAFLTVYSLSRVRYLRSIVA
ncbi:MAG: acyltransferase family protein [Planctomycetaceae bacterium]|nr:acyltransferase family protein [Planctomycetaceae bacterium]